MLSSLKLQGQHKLEFHIVYGGDHLTRVGLAMPIGQNQIFWFSHSCQAKIFLTWDILRARCHKCNPWRRISWSYWPILIWVQLCLDDEPNTSVKSHVWFLPSSLLFSLDLFLFFYFIFYYYYHFNHHAFASENLFAIVNFGKSSST